MNFTKRKAVSQIIGTMFMMAIVGVVGSVILLNGITTAADFTLFLDIISDESSEAIKEIAYVEHVRFDPTAVGGEVDIWIRNIGIESVQLDKITLVKVGTQDLIFIEDVDVEVFPNSLELISFTSEFTLSDFGGTNTWNGQDVNGDNYDVDTYYISFSTTRGNLFDTVVALYNT